ncbi:MAG: acyl-CoA synthetase (AMP-forming)/AMP-acid ligase II [bacterium]|nr:MAG: acyl-CoA synthetase (AMP-forming)/AMP-acid ligase II [bacterium]
MLLGDILRRNAKLFPDKTAVIFKDKRCSYRELNDRVKRLANGLKAKGIEKGDKVGLLEHPCPQYIELYIAIPKIGAVLTPLNCRLAGRELEFIINDAEVKMLIMGEEFVDIVRSIRSNLKTVDSFFCLGKSMSDMGAYEDMIEKYSTDAPHVDIEDEDVAVQMYTSGTTGRPKGVLLTHKNLILMYMSRIIDLKLDQNDVFLSSLPFFHTAAEYALITLYIGGALVIHSSFDPGRFLEAIEKERVTVTGGVPAMVNFLLQHMEKHPRDYDFSSLRIFAYGAAPMPVTLARRTIETFKCDIYQSYGITEASPGVTLLRPEDHVLDGSDEKARRLASCGKEIFNVEVRVVDGEGVDVRHGEVGEIIVRSDSVMKGYWKLPKETAETIRDGWLHTGDMGTVDEKGYIFIVDRRKDMIISGGENIYPREVEEVLYTHTAILEAAVIGIPDEKWGESVKAFVVLKEGKKVSEDEIIDFCKKNMASYKKPKSVEFVDALPRNPVGKVLKKELREKYWKGYGRRVS